jgi:hypothetical protein
MPRDRIPELTRDTGGSVQVGSPEELAQVLAFEGADLSSDERIRFESALWRPVQDVRERAEIYRFLTSATEQVCAAGLLPRPREELVPFGARVEVMRVGGEPPPPNRYHTGTVNSRGWNNSCRTWWVTVAPDPPAGTYYGRPFKGIETWMYDVQLVGGPERPFSSMTPTEIEELHEQRVQEFWRKTRALTHGWCWCGQLHDYPLHHHGAIPCERPSAAELREAHKVRAAGGRRSGRSGTDRLRNFEAMNGEKLLDVFMTVLYEDNDPEAQDAAREAVFGRGGFSTPDDEGIVRRVALRQRRLRGTPRAKAQREAQ